MIKHTYIFIFLVFISNISLFASNKTIYQTSDSITNSNSKKYLNIGKEYFDISLDTTIIIMNKIINVTKNKATQIEAYNIAGKANYYKTNYSEAINNYKHCLLYYKENKDDINTAKVLNRIGVIYQSWGITDKALEYLFQSVEVYKQLNDSIKTGSIYNNIGLAYRDLNKDNLALDFYKLSYRLVLQSKDTNSISSIANNLGSAYVKYGNFDSAKYYFDESVKYKKLLNNEEGLAHSYGNLSDMYYELGDYKTALNYLKKVKYISERHNNLVIRALVNSSLGKIYTKLEIYNLAEDYLKEAMKYANEIKSNQIALDIAHNFSDLYIKTKNYKKASSYLNKYIIIKDSIFSEENIKRISELQVAYNMENSQKENEMLKKINKLNQQKIDNFKNIKHYFIVIIILVLLLIIVVYSRIKNNIKNNKIISEKTIEIRNVNSQLIELNSQLKSKVDNRTESLFKEIEERKIIQKELQISLDKLQKANTLKDRFLANISHEIRTPLNAISGLSSLLKIKIKNEEVLEYISGIYQNSNRLLNLLNNIIDFSKIESNELKLSIENVNLNEIIDNVLQLYNFRINEQKLELILETNKMLNVFVDKVYLSKVLNELIDNAVRYTKEGYIKIETGELNTNEIFIKIIDTGIGIDSQYLPHIFDSFTQESEGYHKKFQGIGLGLPLSKKFIVMNKGRIEVSSKKNKGTIVKIVLPTNNKTIVNNNKNSIIISDALFKQKEFQIFLIEDDYFNRLMLETILENIGIVTSASGGNEALDLISKKHNTGEEFDIMIIDINLPDGWDGISLMKTIREKWPIYNDIIFIAQTAYANSEDKKRFLDSGFNEYITKPIDSEKLINMIKFRLMT